MNNFFFDVPNMGLVKIEADTLMDALQEVSDMIGVSLVGYSNVQKSVKKDKSMVTDPQ